ncbi:uncharacterized protein LOC100142542 [Tribolium castaneum]|uniref:Uncharacterized protein n=1 Tax=Tribolium castaneum TaxID=7070 RepID=A0A139WC50_TRICA|nr:PREDICTED: uncharacterized protein LOC100142542 [Tribolium castaneum]KYB25425.1 hypothetical protein TcasGA2_TC034482 [Tribolium castaneum]|eukprot:XP_015839248.1 PREDICTED: uncharacterized protein LOC100142542 [Tribolium castaneum]
MLFLLPLLLAAAAGGRPRCGGLLTAARGILQTPSFPSEFPVPIHCEWVIDAQNFASPNTSIVVYLTQLYVHEGLTFTEYQVYDRTYQLDGREIHRVNETNVVQVRWVQSFQNFLVVTLKLDSVDSAHLRVLDGFLDVYGFNITYEIARGPARVDSCTIMDCGFTGICYDHYTKFSCECFPGYSGPHCSSGPNSFCANANPTCKNGGTCIHVGVSAVKCHCQMGFTGETCQIPVTTLKPGCDNCVQSCPFDGRLENACKCPMMNGTNDRVGFTSTMHLANLPNLSGNALKTFIENQVFRTLKTNYSKLDDVSVQNVAFFRSGADVTFHLFALKKDEKRIRAVFSRWADRGYIANLTVTDKEFVFKPMLDLQSVSINQIGPIRQNDEFILSCVARGSPTTSFRWFKDGVFVNVTEITSHKWNRLIKYPHSDDQYTALLGISRSDILDSGTFTCQVEDYGIQQCLSRRVAIKAPPVIKVEPMSLTVRKGQNLTIKCISMGDSNNKYTYSWTKNKELIPVRSETEKYEILYPGGSILQIFKIEKSVKFSCLVQDGPISSETSVDIHVVDPSSVPTCPPEYSLNVTWPETAPDTDSLQECPKGYAFPGFVRRSCTLNDGLRPIWRQPDYSQCTPEQLYKIGLDLRLLQLGYETATPLQIIQNCSRYLGERQGLLPGEGTGVLAILRDVIGYCKRARVVTGDLVKEVFEIVDGVLRHQNSLVSQEQVKLLQEVVSHQIEISAPLLSPSQPLFHLALPTLDVNLMSGDQKELPFLSANLSGHKWTPHKTRISSKDPKHGQCVIGVVIYRNLSAFLPTRSVIRVKDGAEVEYEVISQVVRLWILSRDKNYDYNPHIILEWKQGNHNATKDGWFLKCAMAETAMYAYAWNTTVCTTKILGFNLTRCICPKVGTFALLLTANNIQIEKEEPRPLRYIVLAGCSLCFLSALISTIILTIHWILKRSCVVFLKLQCSVSITGVMLTFVLVTISDPSERLFASVMAILEILFLMGLSAHISILLMVYTEMVQLPKSAASKQTVVGISTGVPVIAVFGNHLAHQTMDVRLKSWWLLAGSLAFNIFLTVGVVIVGLFVLLHVTVLYKLKKLTTVHEKEGKILQKRITLLKKSAYVFCSLVSATVSSIFYVNFVNIVWWHYEFSVVTMLLGLVVVVCYVVKSDGDFFYLLQGRFKAKQKDGFFGVEATGSPLNFFTKEDAEVESESIPHHRKSEPSKPIECFPMSDSCKSGLPECVSGAMESYAHSDAIYCAQTSLERYNRSPQLHRKTAPFKIEDEVRCRSPDIIATKICTQLDLVASHAPSIVITPEERPMREIEREIDTVCEKIELESGSGAGGDNLDGMLDRISHDLDYLLNRSEEGPRRHSKTNIITEQIIEEVEEEGKVPDAITDILRTNC